MTEHQHSYQPVCACGDVFAPTVPTELPEPYLEELPDFVLSNLRSHSFPLCELCGAYVEDPEAIERCPGPPELRRGA